MNRLRAVAEHSTEELCEAEGKKRSVMVSLLTAVAGERSQVIETPDQRQSA